ncbi:hypothetical protein NPIL_235771 [Nephila pilipes]|uniref:Uncharacterized protein n=1 Tax=Nephila pilipes TaxID=299642 RepID=A0A8X6JY78_NEPPI|nr:hypothetical protein NPIL_235771 [Nephila pilipes]
MEVKVSLARAKTGNLCSCAHTPYTSQKSDWAVDENHSIGNNKGGGGGGRGGGTVGPPTIRQGKNYGQTTFPPLTNNIPSPSGAVDNSPESSSPDRECWRRVEQPVGATESFAEQKKNKRG